MSDDLRNRGALLPCPFCGGKPYLTNVDMAGCSYAVCTDCRMQSDDGTQEHVRAAWNRRAAPAKISAVLDDTSARAEVGEIGNQIHNIGCEIHDNDSLRDRLGNLASRCWQAAQGLPAEPDRRRERR